MTREARAARSAPMRVRHIVAQMVDFALSTADFLDFLSAPRRRA
jgi:hypothetical protein